MIFIKYSKKCKSAFDIGINKEVCPKCRNKKSWLKNGERKRNN